MAGATYFFYGTLRHAPLLEVVLGRAVSGRPAWLADHAVYWAAGQSFPVIRVEPGAEALGLVIEGISEAEAARLDFYEGGFDYAKHTVTVRANGDAIPARVYMPRDHWPVGEAWRLEDWTADWGDVVTEAAREFMALQGVRSSAEILKRYPQMLIQAASRLRAAPGMPTALRRHADPFDVALRHWAQPYARFFAVDELDLSFRHFDGSMSQVVNRAVLVSGDAATVLPYDPTRDRVLLIEQFRPGPYARGDSQPWLLEPIAGRIDVGETPEHTVRREALEEAGVRIGKLIPIAGYYPTPAGNSEYLFSYIGLADLPDGWAAGASGMDDEHEDIRAHVIPFDRLMELVETGEAENGPLLLSALFLARHRDRLRTA